MIIFLFCCSPNLSRPAAHHWWKRLRPAQPFFPWHLHTLEVLLQSVVSNRFVVLSGLGLKPSSAFSVFLLFYPSIKWWQICKYRLETEHTNWVYACPEHKQLCLPLLLTPLSVLGAALKLRGSSNPISLSEEDTGSWWLCSNVASTCIIIFVVV